MSLEYKENQSYLVEYRLENLGRDITAPGYKRFTSMQKVTAKELFEFAKELALTFQLEETTVGIGLSRIHIFDDKNRTHILALELF